MSTYLLENEKIKEAIAKLPSEVRATLDQVKQLKKEVDEGTLLKEEFDQKVVDLRESISSEEQQVMF